MTPNKPQKGLLNPDAEFLSISEVGFLFSPPISRTSMWKWQKNGQIQLKGYTLGSLTFYKRSEVLKEIERHIKSQ